MFDLPIGALIGALVALILLSALFSAAEIGVMTLNRYRLRHLADAGHRGARLASRLLARPDRLLGLILLGNNFANIAASSVATVLALELYGEGALGIATVLLTLVVLIFAEVVPKTFAALHPERAAFPLSFILQPLLTLLYPFVWLINVIANRFLRLLGIDVRARPSAQITAEELKTIVSEARAFLPAPHQDMLLAILDLENIAVEDVMIPRGRIEGVDIDAEWDGVVQQLTHSRHTRLPVYRGSLDRVTGMVHVRKVLNLVRENRLDRESLHQALVEPYFIPRGTPLTKQLLNFKEIGRNTGLVVDEYGDIQGMVTLDDILEEIIGDFGVDTLGTTSDLQPEPDGSYLIKGSMSLRDLNRRLGWELPTETSRTVNGLIVEYLEDLPEPGTSLMLDGYSVEILRTRGTAIETARIRPTTPTTPDAKSPD